MLFSTPSLMTNDAWWKLPAFGEMADLLGFLIFCFFWSKLGIGLKLVLTYWYFCLKESSITVKYQQSKIPIASVTRFIVEYCF